MAKTLHRTLPAAENHVTHSWEVSNAAARLLITPTAEDIGRVVRQLDDNSLWVCVGHDPAVWRRIDGITQSKNNPWEVLYSTPPVSVMQPPGTVLWDEVVDLGQWALVFDQYLCNPDIIVTKLENGVRRATIPPVDHYWGPKPPGHPTPDAPLWGVNVICIPLMSAEGQQEQIDAPGGYEAQLAYPPPLSEEPWGSEPNYSVGVEAGSRGPLNKCRYVRFYAVRNTRVYTPEEEALYADYCIHFNLTGPNNVVAEWVYDIPAEKGALLDDRIIDLRDYGADSGQQRGIFLMEFRRNGKVIQIAHNVGPWEGLTSFDVPTYPVRALLKGWIDTPTRDYEYNNNNGTDSATYTTPYGEVGWADWVGENRPWGDIAVLSDAAYCTSPLRSLVRLVLWRDTDVPDEANPGQLLRNGNGLPDYTPAPGAAPIPIPPGAQDGCKLHVKLVRPGWRQEGMYPFTYEDQDQSPYAILPRISAAEVKLQAMELETFKEAVVGGLVNVQTGALPDPAGSALKFAAEVGGAVPGRPMTPVMVVDGAWEPLGRRAARGDWNSGPQTATGSMQEFEPSTGWWNPVTVEVVPISWPAGAAFQPVVNVVPAVLWGAKAKVQVTLAAGIVYEIRVFDWTVAT